MFFSILKGPPFDGLEINEYEGGHAIVIPLARCDESLRQSSLLCELHDHADDEFLYSEFSFSIVVEHLDGAFPDFATQDADDAKRYYPIELKPKILDAIKSCILLFADKIKPALFYMVAKDIDLDEKRERKYNELIECLLRAGYGLSQSGPDPHGRTFWSLARVD